MRGVNVGLLGLGTVGTGTAKILLGSKLLLEDRCGFTINLTKVCVKDINKKRHVDLGSCQVTDCPDDVICDPDIDVVVELIGGIEPAKFFVMKALENGKQVVTANKALLAEHGEEIFGSAEGYGLDVGFEASVAGGIPIIHTMKEGLVANHVHSIYGIINGTSNYILSRMSEDGDEFSAVLEDAQRLGYAEADPAYDINGDDVAQKLAILGSIAFGRFIKPEEIFTSGISDIAPVDLEYAKEFGHVVKLLAIIKRTGHELEARVHPTMIPKKHMLAGVNGVYNSLFINGDCTGTTMLYGAGAGEMATAGAVVSDIVDICRNIVGGVSKRVPCMNYVSRVPDDVISIKNMSDISCEYYMRFTVVDHPGVLAAVLNEMAENSISVASIIQRRSEEGGSAIIVLVTHIARERDVQQALQRIENLSDVSVGTVLIRVESM